MPTFHPDVMNQQSAGFQCVWEGVALQLDCKIAVWVHGECKTALIRRIDVHDLQRHGTKSIMLEPVPVEIGSLTTEAFLSDGQEEI